MTALLFDLFVLAASIGFLIVIVSHVFKFNIFNIFYKRTPQEIINEHIQKRKEDLQNVRKALSENNDFILRLKKEISLLDKDVKTLEREAKTHMSQNEQISAEQVAERLLSKEQRIQKLELKLKDAISLQTRYTRLIEEYEQAITDSHLEAQSKEIEGGLVRPGKHVADFVNDQRLKTGELSSEQSKINDELLDIKSKTSLVTDAEDEYLTESIRERLRRIS